MSGSQRLRRDSPAPPVEDDVAGALAHLGRQIATLQKNTLAAVDRVAADVAAVQSEISALSIRTAQTEGGVKALSTAFGVSHSPVLKDGEDEDEEVAAARAGADRKAVMKWAVMARRHFAITSILTILAGETGFHLLFHVLPAMWSAAMHVPA